MATTIKAKLEKEESDECPELTPEQMQVQKEILYGLGKKGKEGKKRALVSNYDTYFVVGSRKPTVSHYRYTWKRT